MFDENGTDTARNKWDHSTIEIILSLFSTANYLLLQMHHSHKSLMKQMLLTMY